MTASLATNKFGNLTYWTNSDPQSLPTESSTTTTSLKNAFDAVSNTRVLQSFEWANSTARLAQTGMVEGDVGDQADSNTQYRFDGSNWTVSTSGMVRVIPTSVNGTNVTLTATGKIIVASAGGSSVSIQGIFSSAYTSYLIRLPRIVSSAIAALQVQVMSGSSAISTSTYDYDRAYRVTATATAVSSVAQSLISLSGANQDVQKSGSMEIDNISLAVPTFMNWKLSESAAAGGNVGQTLGGGFQRDSTAYDGIRFSLPTGSFSYFEAEILALNYN